MRRALIPSNLWHGFDFTFLTSRRETRARLYIELLTMGTAPTLVGLELFRREKAVLLREEEQERSAARTRTLRSLRKSHGFANTAALAKCFQRVLTRSPSSRAKSFPAPIGLPDPTALAAALAIHVA